MSDTVETFNVKNVSLRLVHIGSVSIPPDKVVALVDDPKGINKLDVETSDYLEATDEEANWPESEETVEAPKPKAKAKSTAAKSATGAGWAAKG